MTGQPMGQISLSQGFFQMNTLPVGIIIYMTIMIVMNRNYEPEITRRFKAPVFMLFVLLISDNIDYYLYSTHDTSLLHVLTVVTGYSLRIVIMVAMARIAARNDHVKHKKLYAIPAAVCVCLCISALFTHLIFWYGEDGSIQRGPLAFTPHITALFYAVIFGYKGIDAIKKEKKEEGLIIMVGCVLTCACTAIEMIFSFRGALIGAMSLIIVFYYLHIHMECFKVDSLTGAYNRISFRADVDRYDGHIKGLIMIDLNDLKKLNDVQGHDEGDRALKTLAYKTGKCIPQGCYLYRIGGDEFAVLCTDSVLASMKELKRSIKTAMESTKYTWAVGCAEFTSKDAEFSSVYRRADKDMYNDKTLMKGGAP